jgi:periplasmic copper chaperone A
MIIKQQQLSPFLLISLIILLLSACHSNTNAEVTITDAWVRKNAPGQSIGAAYMTLNSPTKTTLVYAEAIDAAGSVEIHSMTMQNGVMKMRMLDELVLAPNQSVALKPGDFHLMLFDLTAPLEIGNHITFRLCFKDADGNITEQMVSAPVKEMQNHTSH